MKEYSKYFRGMNLSNGQEIMIDGKFNYRYFEKIKNFIKK